MKKEVKIKLPKGWEWSSLGDTSLVTLIMGQSPPSETYNKEQKGLPFFQGCTDFGRIHPEPTVWCSDPNRIAEPNDILMTVRAPVGPTNIAKEKCCIGRGIAAIRCKEGLSYKYLIWVLRKFEKQIASEGTGSVFDAIGKDEMKKIEFPFPLSITEQLRTSDMLEHKMNGIEKMRQAALKQKEAISAIKGAILREIFPRKEGDKLPAGWDLIELSSLFTIEKEQIDNSEPSFSSLPFIGMENIESHTRKFVASSESAFEQGESTCLLFNSQHVLYGKLRPYLDKVYLPDKPGRCSTELLPLKPKANYSRNLIAMVLQSPLVINYAVKHSTGGRMPRANMDKLIKLEVPLPTKDSEKEILAGRITTKLIRADEMNEVINKKVEAIEAMQGAILRETFDFQEVNN